MAQALMRKRAETALQTSEERWRSMFEASNLGITVIDLNLHYVATNSAFQAMLGYTENELLQLTPLDITVEEDRDVAEMRLTELQQRKAPSLRGRKTIPTQGRHSDVGSWLLVGGAGHQSKPKMFIGTIIDVTDTRRAQDTLRETQSTLANVLPG